LAKRVGSRAALLDSTAQSVEIVCADHLREIRVENPAVIERRLGGHVFEGEFPPRAADVTDAENRPGHDGLSGGVSLPATVLLLITYFIKNKMGVAQGGMCQLKMTNAAKEWIDVGTFETIADAAARILELEGSSRGGIFLEFHVLTEPIRVRDTDD